MTPEDELLCVRILQRGHPHESLEIAKGLLDAIASMWETRSQCNRGDEAPGNPIMAIRDHWGNGVVKDASRTFDFLPVGRKWELLSAG